MFHFQSHPALRVASIVLATMMIVACTGDETRTPSDTADVHPAATSRDSHATSRAITPSDTDDFGRVIPVDPSVAARVVSLNPTSTEIIFAIGQSSRLVGRSSWDEFPAEVKNVAPLGDAIRPNIESVLAVHPTLVLLYATAENRAAAQAFERAGVRTISLRVDHIAQFLELTRILGRVFNAEAAARAVDDSVSATLQRVRDVVRGAPRISVVWPLWRSPVMVVGGGSYLDELLEIAGANNVFHDELNPSPQVSVEEISRRKPEVVLIGTTGAQDIGMTPMWKAVDAVRTGQLRIVDTKLTGRPSVNLGMAAVSLARVLHPELAARLP